MSSPREQFRNAKTVVVKVGTSVVSRPDGAIAIGRIASVIEQISLLHQMGKRVVLVASGAIGVCKLIGDMLDPREATLVKASARARRSVSGG